MYNFQEIIEKLKDILSNEIKDRKIKEIDVSNALDIKNDNFRKAKQNNYIPYYSIMQFLAKRNLSINWFFFNQQPESLIDATQRYVLLKYNKTEFKAGEYQEDQIEQSDYLILDKALIQFLEVDPSNTELIVVTGDSMEPTIKDHTIAFIDKSAIDQIDGIYAFEYNNGLYVKRFEDLSDQYKIISDNNSYIVYNIPKDEVRLIGKIVGQLGKV
jgi:repressor LexA